MQILYDGIDRLRICLHQLLSLSQVFISGEIIEISQKLDGLIYENEITKRNRGHIQEVTKL